jgi:hypothetical protein
LQLCRKWFYRLGARGSLVKFNKFGGNVEKVIQSGISSKSDDISCAL